MQLVDLEKEGQETGGLRLVADNREPHQFPKIERQFVNFMFLRVSPDWRKLNLATKGIFKAEFQTVFNEFSQHFLLYSYSLVGFDSKADLMFWRIGNSLDLIQEMTAKLYRTNLGSFLETTDNYLSITKKMMFCQQTTQATVKIVIT
jgi:chlorite dismutase